MTLSYIDFLKLPDTPYTDHSGLYEYMMQLNRVIKQLSGRVNAQDRVLLQRDLSEHSSVILNELTPAPAWDDLRFPVQSVRLGAANPPEFVKLTGLGEVLALAFDKAKTENIYFTVQMPHAWKAGSEIRPHIHWTSTTGNAGNVVWKLEYTVATPMGEFPSTNTIAMTVANPAQYRHAVSSFDRINMAGKKLSTILLCRLYREGGNASDTLDEDAYLLEVDFHYQVDSFGSYQEFNKGD